MFPYYLANEAHYANQDLEVTDKYTNELAFRVAVASAEEIDRCDSLRTAYTITHMLRG